jgi:hypothetical protein
MRLTHVNIINTIRFTMYCIMYNLRGMLETRKIGGSAVGCVTWRLLVSSFHPMQHGRPGVLWLGYAGIGRLTERADLRQRVFQVRLQVLVLYTAAITVPCGAKGVRVTVCSSSVERRWQRQLRKFLLSRKKHSNALDQGRPNTKNKYINAARPQRPQTKGKVACTASGEPGS